MRICCPVILLLLGALAAHAWTPVFTDDFARERPGPDWLSLDQVGRGLRIDRKTERLTFSHSAKFLCTRPLPGGDLRVTCDVYFPPNVHEKGKLELLVRSGTAIWSGGGLEQALAVTLDPRQLPAETAVPVVFEIRGDSGTVTVAGNTVVQQPVPAATSEYNRYFAISGEMLNAAGNTALDNVVIAATDGAVVTLPTRANTADDNAAANRLLADLGSSRNPGVAIQTAIDALPPGGGAVVLPAGTFVLRRHLRLRSGVALIGQGAGKTILQGCPGSTAKIVDLKAGADTCAVTLAAADAAAFRVGDGVSFNELWANPVYPGEFNTDCVVAAVDGPTVTVRARVKPNDKGEWPKDLRHWFPLVCAYNAEWVEVRDLTLRGAPRHNASMWGGFMNCPITFGRVAAPRIARVEIDGWRGDGISVQGSSDCLLTDCTVRGAYQGLHPGGGSENFLCARNLSIDNQANGLYFCWYNQNGVYLRNTVDWFDGYAWPRDKANIIIANDSRKHLRVEQGEYGVIFANRFADLAVGHGREHSPTHYFLLAENTAASFKFEVGDVSRCLYAGNRTAAGEPLAIPPGAVDSVVAPAAPAIAGDLAVGCGRDAAVPPPTLPEPIIPVTADFQGTLDRTTGGTVLLPAGRYALDRPLRVPSGVTLAGMGVGTVLIAADGFAGPLVVVDRATASAVRDLTILGDFGTATGQPAIQWHEARGECVAVDIRGWGGDGIAITGGDVAVRDCRVFGAAGAGIRCEDARLTVATSIVRACDSGFVVRRAAGESLFEGTVAGECRADGYLLEDCGGLVLRGTNANRAGGCGYRLRACRDVRLTAGVATDNGRQLADDARGGIRLEAGCTDIRITYCLAADTKVAETQFPAIVEDATCAGTIVRHCIAVAASKRFNKEPPNSIVLAGKGSEYIECVRQ